MERWDPSFSGPTLSRIRRDTSFGSSNLLRYYISNFSLTIEKGREGKTMLKKEKLWVLYQMAILTLSVTFVARQLEVLVCLMSGANVKKSFM